MPWYFYALLSALAAAATAIPAKLGVEGVPSTVATAIRTVVVLVLASAVVLSAGHQRVLPTISGRALVFLRLSGVATAISWLAYFRALQAAPASLVAPIDKLSLPFKIVLASVVLREPVTLQQLMGVALMLVGALLVARKISKLCSAGRRSLLDGQASARTPIYSSRDLLCHGGEAF